MTAEEQAEHVRRVKAAEVGQSNGHAPAASAARPSLDDQVCGSPDREQCQLSRPCRQQVSRLDSIGMPEVAYCCNVIVGR